MKTALYITIEKMLAEKPPATKQRRAYKRGRSAEEKKRLRREYDKSRSPRPPRKQAQSQRYKEYQRKHQKEYREKNKEKIKEKNKEYRKKKARCGSSFSQFKEIEEKS